MEEVDAQNFSCGEAIESRTHGVAACELHKKERDVLEGGMLGVNEDGMTSFDALDTSEKPIATL